MFRWAAARRHRFFVHPWAPRRRPCAVRKQLRLPDWWLNKLREWSGHVCRSERRLIHPMDLWRHFGYCLKCKPQPYQAAAA